MKKKTNKSGKTKNIIIIVLVCAIAAMGAVLGYFIYQNKTQPDNTPSQTTEQTTSISAEALEEILK